MAAGYVSYERCEVPRQLQVTGFYTAFEKRFPPDFNFDGEAHDFWEMVYVAEGTVGVAADQNVYTLAGGQMILHRPMEFHRIWAAGGTSPRVIILSFSAVGLQWETDGVRTIPPAQGALVRRSMDLIHEHFQMEDVLVKRIRAEHALGAQKAARLLEYLLLALMEEQAPVIVRDDSQSARQYQRLVAIMEENLSRSMSMAELTQACGISESTAKRLFARYAGMGPMRYFMEMKIRQAMVLLMEGRRVGEVSENLGFENQNYFCTAFKRVTGSSPTQFRKLQD